MLCCMLNIWCWCRRTGDLCSHVRMLIPAGSLGLVTCGLEILQSESDLIRLRFSSSVVTFLQGWCGRDLAEHIKTKPTQAHAVWEGRAAAAAATWGEKGIMGDYDLPSSSTFPVLYVFLNLCRGRQEIELILKSRQQTDLTWLHQRDHKTGAFLFFL